MVWPVCSNHAWWRPRCPESNEFHARAAESPHIYCAAPFVAVRQTSLAGYKRHNGGKNTWREHERSRKEHGTFQLYIDIVITRSKIFDFVIKSIYIYIYIYICIYIYIFFFSLETPSLEGRSSLFVKISYVSPIRTNAHTFRNSNFFPEWASAQGSLCQVGPLGP